MPIDDYFCQKCDAAYEIFRGIHEYTGKDPCPSCGNVGERDYSSCKIMHTGTSVKDAYKCPALGQIIKSDVHRKELSRQLGVEEIGNEKPDNIHKHFDTSREEKLKKSWDEV